MRGTTVCAQGLDLEGVISIHVPREGDDQAAQSGQGEIVKFQSTSPVRGTTLSVCRHDMWMYVFQSTSPVRGTTVGNRDIYPKAQISIHVPREGDD